MKKSISLLAMLFFINLILNAQSQLEVLGGALTISAGCGTCTNLPAKITLSPADLSTPGYVSLADQTLGDGNKTFSDNLSITGNTYLSVGSISAPSLAFTSASNTGFSYSTSGINKIAISFPDFNTAGTSVRRFVFRQNGSFNLNNTIDGTYISGQGLDINILHDADNVENTGDRQDGGVNVSTYAGDDFHTGTFGGRTASGSLGDGDNSTLANQALVEFIGKGWADGSWENSNRGVYGVYSAQNHNASAQGAFCGIQTTKLGAVGDHFSFLIDATGNSGLTFANTISGAVFHTSLPNGWDIGTGTPTRFFSVESETSTADVGLLIQNGSTSGGAKGINFWFDNSEKITYFDNIINDDAGKMFIRLKTLGTPVNAMEIVSITGTPTTPAIGIGGNFSTTATPVSAIQIDRGSGVSSEIRWTTGTGGTGQGTGDGFTIGISSGSDAEIRQKETNKDLLFYERDALILSMINHGNEIITGSLGNPTYRTVNGTSGTTTYAHLTIDPTGSVSAGNIVWGYSTADGFVCTQGNGTRRVLGFAIQPIDKVSTASSEAMGMAILTQSGGTAATTKFVIEPDGRVYGTALHNTGSVTGTTNQYIASGTYTPTITNSNNLDAAASATQAQWIRVGNVVTVSGRFTADPVITLGLLASFESSVPIASNIGAAEDCSGTAFCGSISGQGAEVIGEVTNDTAKIQWNIGNSTSQTWSYTYTYEIK